MTGGSSLIAKTKQAAHGKSFAQAVSAEMRPLISLAVPLVVGLAGSTMLGLTDTYFIGPLGETALAAIAITTSVLTLVYGALYGFLGPVSVLIGQAFGANDERRISSVMRHALLLAGGSGIATAVLLAAVLPLLAFLGQPAEVLAVLPPYWLAMALSVIPFAVTLVYKQLYDSVDRPWTGLVLMLIPVVVNIPLTWTLVGGRFGLPALGLFGAGLSSLVAYAVGAVAMALHYQWASTLQRYRLPAPWRAAACAEQIRAGVPFGAQYLFEGGAVTIAGLMIGWLGATALAANQIVASVGAVLYMVPLGMAGAASIRVAQATGTQARRRIRAIGGAAVVLVTIWTLLFTVLLVSFGEAIAAFFVDDRAIIGLATLLFLATGLMQVFDGLQSVLLGILRGLLDTRWPTLVSLVAYWLIALPFGYFLAFHTPLGAAGIWAGFGSGLAVAAGLLAWRFYRQTRRV